MTLASSCEAPGQLDRRLGGSSQGHCSFLFGAVLLAVVSLGGCSSDEASGGQDELDDSTVELRIDSSSCEESLLVQLETGATDLVADLQAQEGASDSALAAGVGLEEGQTAVAWRGVEGIEFELRFPGSTPVGDGSYGATVDLPGGLTGHQQDSTRGAVHHLVVVMLDPQGGDDCDLASISAFAQPGGAPPETIREALTAFATSMKITVN
jgi:hypothetical protein